MKSRPEYMGLLAISVAGAGMLLLWALDRLPTGAMAGFSWAFPLVAVLGAWLVGQGMSSGRRAGLSLVLFCLLLAAPAMGVGTWMRLVALQNAEYLEALQAMPMALELAANVARFSAPMLLLAGLVGLVVCGGYAGLAGEGRAWSGIGPWRWACVAVVLVWMALGAGAALCGRLLALASQQSVTGNPTTVAWLVQACVWAWLLLLPPLFFLAWRGGAAGAGVNAALAGCLALALGRVAVWPPVLSLLDVLPLPEPTPRELVRLPETDMPGRSLGGEILSADARALPRVLEMARHPLLPGMLWSQGDLSGPPWPRKLRATVSLLADSGMGMDQLEELARILARHGVHRLGLVGHCPVSPAGPLGRFLAWPTVTFLLDDPAGRTPAQGGPALWLTRLGNGRVYFERPFSGEWGLAHSLAEISMERGSACLLVSDPSMTVGTLYSLGRQLGGPLQGAPYPDALALAFPAEDRPGALDFHVRAMARGALARSTAGGSENPRDRSQ